MTKDNVPALGVSGFVFGMIAQLLWVPVVPFMESIWPDMSSTGSSYTARATSTGTLALGLAIDAGRGVLSLLGVYFTLAVFALLFVIWGVLTVWASAYLAARMTRYWMPTASIRALTTRYFEMAAVGAGVLFFVTVAVVIWRLAGIFITLPVSPWSPSLVFFSSAICATYAFMYFAALIHQAE